MDMSGCPFINFTQYRCHHPMWHITDADGINLFAWSLCFPFRILWGIVFHWNHRLLIVWPSPIEPLDRRSWGQRRHFAAPVYSTSSFDWHWTLRLFHWNSSPEVPVRNVKSLFMFLALAQDVLRFWYRSRCDLITHLFSHVYWHQSIKIINMVALWVRRRLMHRKEDGTFLGHQDMRMACRITGT